MMKGKSIELAKKFAEITGIIPISASLGVGSMRPYVRFRLPDNDETAAFATWDNLYKDMEKEGKKNWVFKGVPIEFVDESVHKNPDEQIRPYKIDRSWQVKISILELL